MPAPNWKPAKGTALLHRIKRRQVRAALETQIRKGVRIRDRQRCRWPGCRWEKKGVRLEVAHLHAKGIGGDKKLRRTTRDQLILLCFLHHQGERSLHSGDLKVVPETHAGTDGLCRFLEQTEAGWKIVGVN